MRGVDARAERQCYALLNQPGLRSELRRGQPVELARRPSLFVRRLAELQPGAGGRPFAFCFSAPPGGVAPRAGTFPAVRRSQPHSGTARRAKSFAAPVSRRRARRFFRGSPPARARAGRTAPLTPRAISGAALGTAVLESCRFMRIGQGGLKAHRTSDPTRVIGWPQHGQVMTHGARGGGRGGSFQSSSASTRAHFALAAGLHQP